MCTTKMAEGSVEKDRQSSRKMDRSHENAPNEVDQNGEEIEPNFSDPEDYVDDVKDDELLGDILKQRPQKAIGSDSVIVVDNIPNVGQDRLPKLKNVIRRIFSKFGDISTEHYPDDNGVTKGFIFLEFSSPANAIEAAKQMNGYRLDKTHTFSVNLFSDIDKYTQIDDKWEPPKPQPYKDFGNLRFWLQEPDCNDQYSVIFDGGEKTAIFMNTSTEASVVEERKQWTETYVRWSPQGNYLSTFHHRGIALWGGPKFEQIKRFAHPGVQLIDFSPCERYLVTFSPLIDVRDDPQAIIIWDVQTGKKKRGFHCESAAHWPIFKWNHDGKYFAKQSQDTLSIYETPSFGLMEKKSMKITEIRDFGWSPADNILAYWVPEVNESPARVTLVEIPSRKELRAKTLYNVADCKIHWQKQGDYLGVKVDRYTNKNKKVSIWNFELFRIREKQIPVDQVELKETITAFAWEPTGSRFCCLHGEAPRISASFYKIHEKGKVELVKTLERKQANCIFWAPTGQFVVLAGLRSMNGTFEFIDAGDMTSMNQTEHFMATDLEWDPTGRYVITGVSWWSHKVDNAYWVWSFQGRLLQKCNRDRFCQLLWRPRPASLLTDKHLKDLKKNMKTYSKQFELKDRMSHSKASKELIEKRQQMLDEFNSFRQRLQEQYEEERQLRMELRDGVDTDCMYAGEEEEEEVIEFFVGEEIIEVNEFEGE
ncbi:eukaryotic translation initiation factor 3 subunit B-like [Patiria miniata]|uniref:Eukaryotic translation initiation factor 3 subunit B n=1 Tax=Patiria miniata TaxID=46514 RepID=A0A914AUZ7_PATMI|nr:eukaryotic translation initiation factor 3 subunit B-like [Patiria miniata]